MSLILNHRTSKKKGTAVVGHLKALHKHRNIEKNNIKPQIPNQDLKCIPPEYTQISLPKILNNNILCGRDMEVRKRYFDF
jgi:hypothetical protein